mmetsp:Transcript_8641/g.31911  ORF Transcript_8641/g.31911 Transcript_8641/m.31911 type:complete len:502 (-) Transcript_8641:59-1564(-)|eukprot:CAMPEP_0117442684 /NCGR_PEP_ID=MMETSP0759-20121206/4284_1 /TAXON_ID=63605 /ORGANISM="Percolomonas cosmopolitus, Strain WS" /LENGTH=501 /DNA_ID=CAMNT_0005234591 /DNA_START=512 /DNA_END=2017 /DNA_ORIENTATION=+
MPPSATSVILSSPPKVAHSEPQIVPATEALRATAFADVACNSSDQVEQHSKKFSISQTRKQLPKFSHQQVLKHDKEDDCWIIIDNLVYDVTSWVPKHPGGDIIYKFAGRDVTDLFLAFHLPQTERMKCTYLIGELTEPVPVNQMQKDCRKLREKFIKEGFFQSSLKFYILDNLYCIFLFGLVLLAQYFGVYWGNEDWLGGKQNCTLFRIVVGGALMGFFWQEVAALLHDSMHSELFHEMRFDDMVGWLYSCVCFGISGQWWKNNHNKHHAYPNCLNPDGTIADQQQDVRPFFVQYPTVKPYVTSIGEKLLIKIQHFTFIPIVWFVGRYAILIDSYVNRSRKHANWELFGFALHWAWVLCGVYHAGTTWKHSLSAYAIAAVVEGVLHLQLEMNHFCKPMIPLDQCVNGDIDFYSFQCITSRNVRLVIPFEWRLHGGLHKQVEHHMFPLIPRHNLHKLTPHIIEVCKKNGVVYDCTHTFPGAIWTVIKNLYNIGYMENPTVVH